MSNQVFFFVGTEAELIKVFPVIMECQKNKKVCHIIASGQNDLTKSRILDLIRLNGKFVELSKEETIEKSALGLLKWFGQTRLSAIRQIKNVFSVQDFKDVPFVVHGDTVSTFMGAWIGNKLGARVCHVEAGLRSHNLFNPFPEEIDRLLTSRIARVHFAPGKDAENNLLKAKGKVINTQYNTILDSLNYSTDIPIVTEEIRNIISKDYFVFVMHRQENLGNKDFVVSVMDEIIKAAEKKKCVLILHKITENVLENMGILENLRKNPNFILLPRVDYFDFMKLLQNSKYVITDGGSNQEELHYMGKPCLIMRKTTERSEGIGENAILFGEDISNIQVFINNYETYKKQSIVNEFFPSRMIADSL